jgi:curved DNA-binding protein CbpA
MTPQEAAAILGVAVDGDEPQVRAAYVRRVVDHPPDVDPDGFERVREAYELLRDPVRRALSLFDADPRAPLTSLLAGPSLRFVGPDPWVAAIREGIRTCRTND